MQYIYMKSKEHGLMLFIKMLSELHALEPCITNNRLHPEDTPLESYSVMRFPYIMEPESLLPR
jgi:hypothetical protein